MQMVEQANAECCCRYCCSCCWYNLVYGPIIMQGNGKARISTDDLAKKDPDLNKGLTVDVAADVEDAFLKPEDGMPAKEDFGFIVLKSIGEKGKPPTSFQVTAFVPVNTDKHARRPDIEPNAQTVVNDYNKAFEQKVLQIKKGQD